MVSLFVLMSSYLHPAQLVRLSQKTASALKVLTSAGVGDSVLNHQVRQHVADRVVWGRVRSEHWTYLYVINSLVKAFTNVSVRIVKL